MTAACHVAHAAFRRPIHRPVFRPDYHGGVPAPHGTGTNPAPSPPAAAAQRPVSGGGAIGPEIGGGLGDIGPVGSGGFDRVDTAPRDTGHWGAGGPAAGKPGGDPGGRRKDSARRADSAGRVLPVFIVLPTPYLAGFRMTSLQGRFRPRIPRNPMAPGGIHHHSPTDSLHAIISPQGGRHNGTMNPTPRQRLRTTREPQTNCALVMTPGNPQSHYWRAW